MVGGGLAVTGVLCVAFISPESVMFFVLKNNLHSEVLINVITITGCKILQKNK